MYTQKFAFGELVRVIKPCVYLGLDGTVFMVRDNPARVSVVFRDNEVPTGVSPFYVFKPQDLVSVKPPPP